jgi:hypothetical protein
MVRYRHMGERMIKGEKKRGRHREGILEGKRIEGDGKRGRHIFFNGIWDSSLLLMGFFTNRIIDRQLNSYF